MDHGEGTLQGSGGIQLYYQRWRPAGKPRSVLLVVHGLGEHGGRYMNVVNRLVPDGHAVYALDHRGHGRSPGQKAHIDSWQQYREDVRAFFILVRAQEPGIPVFMLAHSLGGLIGLDYLIAYPEGLRGAIISGAFLDMVKPPAPPLLAFARLLSRLWPHFPMDTGLDANAVSRDPAVVAAYRADPLVHGKSSARWAVESFAAIDAVKANAAKITLPLLMVHGGSDGIISPEGSRRIFPTIGSADKELRIYEGCYHEPHNDPDHEKIVAGWESWIEKRL